MPDAATTVVIAGLSARQLGELAVRDGYAVRTLDLFGDADTRALGPWRSLGSPAQMQINLDVLRASLHEAGRRGATAWVAAAGFEACPQGLESGGHGLPLLGNGAAAVAAVRDPQAFFEAVQRAGLSHPETRFTPPAGDGSGWYWKHPGGHGGWRVRPSALVQGAAAEGGYWQRQVEGEPWSLTLLMNGCDAVLLGLNRQQAGRHGDHPCVFEGIAGPMPVSLIKPDVLRRLKRLGDRLALDHGLRGLCSLDLLIDTHGQTQVLELNPRPPASAGLFGAGIFEAHVRACQRGELPDAAALAAPDSCTRVPLGALRIVYARHAMPLEAPALQRLARLPDVHDRPASPGRLHAGEPVCTLSARAGIGEDADTLLHGLNGRADRLLEELETA